jgi:hypothetical protein
MGTPHLDLPNRCLKPITPELPEADDSAYYTVCARPTGHAHGCMSAAVWERKEAVREAKAKGWNPQKATDIPHFVAIGHIDLSHHPSGFEVGDLVFHDHHGEGHVTSLNDDGGVTVEWHGKGGTVNDQ